MRKILACYKWVLDERDIRVNPTDGSLSTERAAYKISDYDLNAIEEAVLVKESCGGEVWVLTIGSASVESSIKDAVSRGADGAYVLNHPLLQDAGPLVTSQAIAAVAAAAKDYDLILMGEGSCDNFSQQVGPRVAELLGIPVVTYVDQLTVQDNRITARRKLETCDEIVHVPLPAVVCVTGTINHPRVPGMKQIITASKKPVIRFDWNELTEKKSIDINGHPSRIVGNISSRRQQVLEGAPKDMVDLLFNSLVKDGVIAG